MAHYQNYPAIVLLSLACVVSSCSSSGGSSTPVATPQAPETDTSAQISSSSEQTAVPVPLDLLDPSAIPDDNEPDVVFNVSYSDSQSNTLTSEQINIIPLVTVDDVFEAYEAVREANSDLPINTNQFSLLLVDYLNENVTEERASLTLRSGSINANEIGADPLGVLSNKEEEELLINNPHFIPGTRNAIFAAGFATMAGGGVTELLNPAWKDRGDAFRHAYWNWLLSECCGVAWAEAYATAHEVASPINDDDRMDLNNNAVGRAVFAANPAASREQARTAIMSQDLLFINERLTNVTIDDSRLVYLLPEQAITLFDDGPSFDDVFGFSIDGIASKNTPRGGATTYQFISMSSGIHDMEISCVEDNTEAGCGFKYTINGAMFNGMGTKSAGQIVIQKGETYSDTLTLPKIIDLFTE